MTKTESAPKTNVPFLEIKITDPDIRAEIDRSVRAILDEGAYIGGAEVRSFEEEFGAFCGGGRCVSVANGTDALIVALKAFSIGPGDEVITVPFTFIATAEAVTAVGATVKFVDIDPRTFNINVEAFQKAVTPKTKAVIVVHLFGRPCDMDAVNKVAAERNIRVIEDACQAHGAEYKGRRVGILGDAACFSFYPTKNLGGFGDGGAIVIRSEDVAARVTLIANHGRSSQYFHEIEGLNSRLDAVQAAFLRVKLKRLDAWNDRRREIAGRYTEALKGHVHISPPAAADDSRHVYHLYCVQSPHRDALKDHLTKNGIGNGVYYPLSLHLQPAYQYLGYEKGAFPVSEKASKTILALPMFPGMTAEQVDRVIHVLASFKV